MKKPILVVTHLLAVAGGFALGVYLLPILTAPEPPSSTELAMAASGATYRGEFRRDLKGSDALHWGEGDVFISARTIAFAGRLAPGPNYKLYLSTEFVETEADFRRLKPTMVQVGDVRTFENFAVPVASTIDPSGYTTVIVWCEAFNQFITSARYR
ncbi:MAG: DM13 domain-containing protein [Burkholderiaceae bacterium]